MNNTASQATSPQTGNDTANPVKTSNPSTYRFSELNECQRQQAITTATRDGRPNCIGLRFTLDDTGNVSGFTDTMPHIRHGNHGPKQLA